MGLAYLAAVPAGGAVLGGVLGATRYEDDKARHLRAKDGTLAGLQGAVLGGSLGGVLGAGTGATVGYSGVALKHTGLGVEYLKKLKQEVPAKAKLGAVLGAVGLGSALALHKSEKATRKKGMLG